jgi:hypothetical protein
MQKKLLGPQRVGHRLDHRLLSWKESLVKWQEVGSFSKRNQNYIPCNHFTRASLKDMWLSNHVTIRRLCNRSSIPSLLTHRWRFFGKRYWKSFKILSCIMCRESNFCLIRNFERTSSSSLSPWDISRQYSLDLWRNDSTLNKRQIVNIYIPHSRRKVFYLQHNLIVAFNSEKLAPYGKDNIPKTSRRHRSDRNARRTCDFRPLQRSFLQTPRYNPHPPTKPPGNSKSRA